MHFCILAPLVFKTSGPVHPEFVSLKDLAEFAIFLLLWVLVWISASAPNPKCVVCRLYLTDRERFDGKVVCGECQDQLQEKLGMT